MNNIFDSAYEGNLPMLRQLVGDGAGINVRDSEGMTALMWASEGGRTQVVQFLLEHGADVNATDDDNWTALLHAAQVNAVETAEELLKHGADARIMNKLGWDFSRIAHRNQNKQLISLIERPDLRL